MFACLCVIVMLVFVAFIVIWQSDELQKQLRDFWHQTREILFVTIALLVILTLAVLSIMLNVHMVNTVVEFFQRLFS